MTAMTTPDVRPTLLFVDDEPQLCHLVQKILGEDGYDVVTAGNGEDALQIADSFHPEIVVLDLNMPVLGGIDTLRELRARGFDCPVIMLTALGTAGTAREAMALGACEYLTKPFNLYLFKSMLVDALAGHGKGMGV